MTENPLGLVMLLTVKDFHKLFPRVLSVSGWLFIFVRENPNNIMT